MKNVLRIVLGVVVGYLVMVALITLVQEVWLGGVTWRDDGLGTLALSGIFTCLSGAIGGAIATAITLPAGRLAGVVMACLTCVEGTYLYFAGILNGPLWFDLVAVASLAVAIFLGAELFLRRRSTAVSGPRFAD